MFKPSVALFSAIILSSCATVFTGTNQAIQLSALDQTDKTPLEHVDCSIVDSSGAIYSLESNPGSVTVSKGKGPLQVKCEQPGYKHYTGAITSNFNSVSVLNVFFWPGFFVDMATGSIQKYPGQYTAILRKNN